MVGITPRGDTTQTPVLLDEIKRKSPIPIDRIMTMRASSTQVMSIVGKWPFLMLGLTQDDMKYYLARQHTKGVQGRLPSPGAPEAIVSRPVAQNLKLKLGSLVLGPEENDNYSPKIVRVVGIADTDRWLMVNSIEYQRENHFPPIDLGLVFAKNLADQDKLDHWAQKHFKGRRAQVWAYFMVEKQTQEMFATLFKMLNAVIFTLAIVITFMMGLLMNIYQSQRLIEFGLLQAIGYTKSELIRRVVSESIAVVILGWLFGVLASYGLIYLAKVFLMDPNAFGIEVFDQRAFNYTVPIPFAIILCAVGTVVYRFRTLDPVGIVERRLV